MQIEFKRTINKLIIGIGFEWFGINKYGYTNNLIIFKLVPMISLGYYPKENKTISIGVEWLNLYIFIGYKFN